MALYSSTTGTLTRGLDEFSRVWIYLFISDYEKVIPVAIHSWVHPFLYAWWETMPIAQGFWLTLHSHLQPYHHCRSWIIPTYSNHAFTLFVQLLKELLLKKALPPIWFMSHETIKVDGRWHNYLWGLPRDHGGPHKSRSDHTIWNMYNERNLRISEAQAQLVQVVQGIKEEIVQHSKVCCRPAVG